MFYVFILINFFVVFSLKLTKNGAIQSNGEVFNIILRRKFAPSQVYSGRRSQQDDMVRFLRKTKGIVSEQQSRKQVCIILEIISPTHIK